ncbi:uncharacterized protein LOC129000340 [Macrosteles quadrilineatus]|uniref:uncharacterized protein LOC129000340 n=1 Tax=Macrosteles quadrilineatus TaxID=74068 RepID=UPI0023E19689|nr:uncharacterized protein LOC129000340 [Macrosteles quadrilineatus]
MCWFSRYGSPLRITTDQGRQFESALFRALGKTFGVERIRTCGYHPCANGLVERFHRQFKAALMCHNDSTWLEALPIVLLGIRSAYREDLQASTAELVFGHQLRLPGELLDLPQDTTREEDPADYVVRLRRHMSNLRPVPTSWHDKPKTFVFQELKRCTHIFLRDDSVRRSLQPPYTGPFPVVSRDDKTMTIIHRGKRVKVTLDRVKPAYLLQDLTPSTHTPIHNKHSRNPPSTVFPLKTLLSSQPKPYVTRSGRTVKFIVPCLPVSAGG